MFMAEVRVLLKSAVWATALILTSPDLRVSHERSHVLHLSSPGIPWEAGRAGSTVPFTNGTTEARYV